MPGSSIFLEIRQKRERKKTGSREEKERPCNVVELGE
jgi:hypothetical protein